MTEEEKDALANLIMRGVDAEHRAAVAEQRASAAEHRAVAVESETKYLRAVNQFLQLEFVRIKNERDELQELLDNPDELIELVREYERDMRTELLSDLYREQDAYH